MASLVGQWRENLGAVPSPDQHRPQTLGSESLEESFACPSLAVKQEQVPPSQGALASHANRK